jgi:hypothetical protein
MPVPRGEKRSGGETAPSVTREAVTNRRGERGREKGGRERSHELERMPRDGFKVCYVDRKWVVKRDLISC